MGRLAPWLPVLLVPLAFIMVLHSGMPAPPWRREIAREPFEARRCTWYCHNHGCRHGSRLPAFLDQRLFDWTVRSLYLLGDRLVPGAAGSGYRAANLLVFCATWPGAMCGLYWIALHQRRQLRALRRKTAS